MCVIIAQPKGSHLEKDVAKRCWDKNSHGGGFAFINDAGTMELEKYMEFDEYWKAFENARSLNPGRDFLLHMRIATHGGINLDNVHPFVVNENTVMAHNGILSRVPDYSEDDRSDTRVFIDEVLPELPANWLDRPYLVDMVEEWMGWSKLSFLTNDVRLEKSMYILNENSGDWDNGMWFSNNSFKEVKKYTGNYKVYKSNPIPNKVDARPLAAVTERDSYADWWNSINEDVPVGNQSWEPVPKGPSGLTELEKRMRELRAEVNLDHDFIWDGMEQEYVCLGCDSPLDGVTNECKCWDVLCVDCSRFTAECECPGGLSQNILPFNNATQEVKDAAIKHAYADN